MSTNRVSPNAGYVYNPSRLPKGPNGRALCRQCGTEVPKGRRTFCGDACVHAWKLKSDPTYQRKLVFERDRGVCAACGLDTEALHRQIEAAAKLDPHRFGAYGRARRAILDPLGIDPHRITLWDMDHIVPVVEGGGECGLDNLRTLCPPCHKRVTAELAARRAERRRAAKRAAARVRDAWAFPEQMALGSGDV